MHLQQYSFSSSLKTRSTPRAGPRRHLDMMNVKWQSTLTSIIRPHDRKSGQFLKEVPVIVPISVRRYSVALLFDLERGLGLHL